VVTKGDINPASEFLKAIENEFVPNADRAIEVPDHDQRDVQGGNLAAAFFHAGVFALTAGPLCLCIEA
jgi:hypothetical protein